MNVPTVLRQLPRTLARQSPSQSVRRLPARRLLNTAPPARTSRSWKNSAARWTLALGIVYWYNTNALFAEEPDYPLAQPLSPTDEASLPTLDSVAKSREQQKDKQRKGQSQSMPSSSETTSASDQADPSPLASTEEEAHSQGAFNEATGEINWDCPCLGGMAHGPCGPEFREAFSCFVYSTEEPKGMECIDKFKGMQDCFRAHPEEYGDELAREEEEREVENEIRKEQEERRKNGEVVLQTAANAADNGDGKEEPGQEAKATEAEEKVRDKDADKHELAGDEGGDLVPKASHDAR